MIALPRELMPWRDLLALFPPDLAGELGRMVPRLALAVGPMNAARPVGDGEPDGFAGIARRGSYERLLLTEWLLADEAPDEFARRAAMGEHAFFHLARRSPAQAKSSVAIFDTGPDQLGAPRVAHLAALIVLAARAERAGARFAWGVLGVPGAALVPSVTAASVMGLLGARTAVAADAGDVAAWLDRAARSGWEDAWLVGSPPAPRAWPHAALEIGDVLDPERRVLSVVARVPRSPPRAVELPLPEPRAVVRLLRDPFSVTAPAPAPRRQKADHAPASNLIFAVNGTKLFARSADGEILAYPLPNSPRDAVGRPKRYHARTPGVIAAVGWVRRGLAMLVITPDAIVIEHTTTRGPELLRQSIPRLPDVPIAVPHAADPLSPLVYWDDGDGEILFLDARRALFRIWRTRNQGVGAPGAGGQVRVARIAEEVSAFASYPSRVAFVGRNPGSDAVPGEPTRSLGTQTLPTGMAPQLDASWHLVDLRHDGRSSSQQRLLGDGTFAACIGSEPVAVQEHGETWVVHDVAGPPTQLTLPPFATVIGVRRSAGPGRDTAQLVLLEGDQRTISFVSRSASRSLPRAAEPIVNATMGGWREQVAYVTAAGEVVIHTAHDDQPLARYAPE